MAGYISCHFICYRDNLKYRLYIYVMDFSICTIMVVIILIVWIPLPFSLDGISEIFF